MAKVRAHFVEKDVPMLEGPLMVVVHYRLPVNAQTWAAKRRRMHLTPHAIRPDRDNLDKLLNDSLTGVVWKDDARIAWVLESKTYTQEKEGSTIFFVSEIPSETVDYALYMKIIEENIQIE